MKRRLWTILALCMICALPLEGSTELVLVNGQVLQGSSCRRDGENYILTLDSGDEIALPVELVETLSLSGSGEPRPELKRNEAVDDTLDSELQPQGDPREADRVPGLVYTEPQTLAGVPPQIPSREKSLDALGPPARFQKSIIDSAWKPKSDWDMNPENNNFNPSTWQKSPVDSSWTPTSGLDERNALDRNRSSFPNSIIDSSWTPTDGFGN